MVVELYPKKKEKRHACGNDLTLTVLFPEVGTLEQSMGNSSVQPHGLSNIASGCTRHILASVWCQL